MKNKLTLIFIIALTLLELHFQSPIGPDSSANEVFSIDNVERHIQNMTEEVHFMGTTANRKVKDYIKSEFAQLNIPTEDFDGHCQIGRQGYKRIAPVSYTHLTLPTTPYV